MRAPTAPPDARIEWNETLERIRDYVTSRVGDRQLAEDITQDIVVRSIASGALERVDNPIGWLIRSASNAVIDHYRTQRRSDPLDPATHTSPHIDTEGDAEETMRQLARCMHPLVSRLEPAYRDALIAVDIDGHTQQEAAAAAHLSISGMKSRVQRARRQLKSLLTACCEIDLDARGRPTEARPRSNATCGCGN